MPVTLPCPVTGLKTFLGPVLAFNRTHARLWNSFCISPDYESSSVLLRERSRRRR